jgi:hypothetical protein
LEKEVDDAQQERRERRDESEGKRRRERKLDKQDMIMRKKGSTLSGAAYLTPPGTQPGTPHLGVGRLSCLNEDCWP